MAVGPLAVTIADDAAADNEEGNTAFAADAAEQQRLLTSAMLTGVAIILHNIPEGLATFVVSWLFDVDTHILSTFHFETTVIRRFWWSVGNDARRSLYE